ncbi:MAG TPA: ribosomal protein S18-alanine N-acetyltransferase [Candidatus Nanopelagicales bacterium]|nr:ribosomal protein S18-alanine N-acetyltransferase [Candidatus Nanopelagicales bacterium]
MSLRPMRWWDIEAVAALDAELFPHDPWSAEQLWGELAHVPETRWYAVHDDDAGVDGYVGLYAVPPDGDVATIAVATRSQRRGLGRELLDALVDEARHRGVTQLFLEVLESNQPALALYEATGFERQGRRRDYYGPGLHAVVLRRRLVGEAS